MTRIAESVVTPPYFWETPGLDSSYPTHMSTKQPAEQGGLGDVTSTEKGSGARYNAGKPDLSLIPLCTLEDEARVWEYGAKKYARNNWQKGMSWNAVLSCALRHLAKFQAGEDLDAETGLPHIAHAICNLRMLTLYSRTYKEGDDRGAQFLGEFIGAKNGS